jgi:formate hydrogenlyase subunit 3/multisubunit Na+/H+ antiporter MnhD subunit
VTSDFLLLALVALPFVAGATALRLQAGRPEIVIRAGLAGAIGLVVLATVIPVGVSLPLAAGRSLVLSPIAQLTTQLIGLATLGLLMALADDPPRRRETWLPVTWLSVGGLIVALLVNSGGERPMPALPIAVLVFVASILLWAFGLPHEQRASAAGPVIRYAALLSLAMPLLLAAFRIADDRLSASAGEVAVERLVLALALPGFGLILGVVPLHAWTLTLASGAPRPMLFGAVAIGQTAGFGLLLNTMAVYPWITRGGYGTVVLLGGALTACVGAWLAASSDPADPDDWIAYAVVANAGMLVAGLGTGSRAAGTGVALLLLARVLALVLLTLSAGTSPSYRRVAYGAAGLALAGTPGFAGFPGLWLIVGGARAAGGPSAAMLAVGSGLLFANALRRALPRRDRGERGQTALEADPDWYTPLSPGRSRAVVVLAVLMVVIGLAPQVVAGAFTNPLREVFFPLP